MKNTFTGKTRLFLGISGALVVIALIMQIAGVGLNLGIDFTGGSLLNYSVGEDYDLSDVEKILESAGYAGSQLTKAAPSEASINRQAEIAAEEAAAEEAAAEEAAVEETATEEAAVEETATEEAATEEAATEEAATEEAATEEAVTEEAATEETATEETATEETAQSTMLDLDKSGIEADGLTDLQIRLNLVDETEGLEDAITGAVAQVLPNAQKTAYTALTNSVIVNKGFDGDYAGGYMAEFTVGEEFDSDAVLAAVQTALADYSVELVSAQRYDAAAEEAAAQSSAEEETEEVTEETTEEAAEETTEETTEEATEETTEEATEEATEETAEAVEETGTDLRVLVRIDDQASQVRSLLETEMTAKYPHFTFITIDHVSAVAGRDLLSNAVKALLIAFVCMLIYIAIRFDVFSGLAALFGLLHDVLIMCSFMVFFRWAYQVNSSFIAAILTIVGYSINNTIIIFDRIRENAKKPGLTALPRKQIVEKSVSETLSRTINTTLTTLITLVALYVFGVDSIREFAFPLVVGMLAGTYSSVLLSGQVWAMWMDKRAARKAETAAQAKAAKKSAKA